MHLEEQLARQLIALALHLDRDRVATALALHEPVPAVNHSSAFAHSALGPTSISPFRGTEYGNGRKLPKGPL